MKWIIIVSFDPFTFYKSPLNFTVSSIQNLYYIEMRRQYGQRVKDLNLFIEKTNINFIIKIEIVNPIYY